MRPAGPLPPKLSRHLPRKAQNGVWAPKVVRVRIRKRRRHERFCCCDRSGIDDGHVERTGARVERSDARPATAESCSHQCRAGGRRPAWRCCSARSARWCGCGRTHHRGSSSGIPPRCPTRLWSPLRTSRIPLGPWRCDRGRSGAWLRRRRNRGGVGGCCACSGLLLVLHRSQPNPGLLGRLPVTEAERPSCQRCD